MRDDFNARFDAVRRSHELAKWFIIAAQVVVVVGIIWLLNHPERIGQFFGAIIDGATQ